MKVLGFLGFSVLLLAACGGDSSPTPVSATVTPQFSPTAVPAASAATPAASPTPLPAPTAEPSPTFSPGAVIMPTVAIPSPTPTLSSADSLTNTLDAVGYVVSLMRELSAVERPERQFISREELLDHLREDFDEGKDKLYEVQELYITLGILEEDVDLYDLLLSIYGDDVLGFFDTEEELMYLVKDTPVFGPRDTLTYAHEYVHALQQQNFDIDSIIEDLKDQSDASRAFRALVEGDASISEIIYMFQQLDEDEQAEIRQANQEAGPGLLASAPHVIQRTRMFPYSEGPRFVIELIQQGQGWDLVNQAFEDLPQSTEQILHPEKYMFKDEPTIVRLPDVAAALGDQWTEVRQNTMGEFFILVYLESSVSPEQAAIAAEGWGGDRYTLLQSPQGQNLLVSLINWDTEGNAQEFVDTFLGFMRARTDGDWDLVGQDGMSQMITLPDQSILLSLDEADTLLIFAPDVETLEAARMAVEEL